MAKLTVTEGPAEREVYDLGEGVTLGRAPHNDIPMPKNRGCSRDHAKIWRSGPDTWSVADLGSTNGTLVNDEKVPRGQLRDGDVVRIGQVVFRFELEESEKPKPKVAPKDDDREDFAAILRGEKKRKDAPAAQQLEGQAAIEVKQRILQYNRKRKGGSQLGWDLTQLGAGPRWAFYLLALGAAAALFFLVMNMLGGN